MLTVKRRNRRKVTARAIRAPRYFVTVYTVERCFGGREEGGWWYDWWTVDRTVPFRHLARARKVAAVLQDRERLARESSRNPIGRYSVNGGADLSYCVERRHELGQERTTQRPVYS